MRRETWLKSWPALWPPPEDEVPGKKTGIALGEGERWSERGRHPFRGLAWGLGWASLGLGAAQLAASNAVRRMSGVDDSAVAGVLVPAVGVRELFHAAALLGGRAPERWV